MKKIVLLAVMSLSVSFAMAEGGKANNPLYDSSGQVVGNVVPVPESCEVVIPQSGKAVYIICDEYED